MKEIGDQIQFYLRSEGRAGEPDPLTREHLHVRRSVKPDSEDVGGQELGLQDVELHVGGPEGHDLVESVDEGGEDEVDPEEGGRRDPLEAVDDAEEVEQHVELVNLPEEVVRLGPDFGMGKDEDGGHRDPESHSRDA